jgi:hypothetical protein
MSSQKPTDKSAFETLIRSGRRTNRVNWTPAPGQDDRDALNRAIRDASGRGAPEPGDQPFPWRSLGDDDRAGNAKDES